MATIPSNRIKYLLATKKIDFANDSFKIILMATGFVFDPDTHHQYSDFSSSELADGNGYTRDSKILTGVTITEDLSNDRTAILWSNPSWVASGGNIGPTPGAIIFDDTEANDSSVSYIDFSDELTQASGGIFTVSSPGVRIS